MTMLMSHANPTSVSAIDAERVAIRTLKESDSIEDLTVLLHRAYKAQIDMGLHPLAGRQSPEITHKRTHSGECLIATLDDRLVGTVLLQEVEDAGFPTHFLKPEVAHFSLLGIDPEMQGLGVGRKLLDATQARAREMGFSELACSMAELDTNLMRFYEKLDFRHVEWWQWPYTNYRSAILSKALGTGH